MRFENMEYIWLLILIPLAIYGWYQSEKIRSKILAQFASPLMLKKLVESSASSDLRRRWKSALLIVGFSFCVIALLRPQWGFHWEEVKRRGVDIVIALDVSKSMRAEDVKPNRMERAKREIKDLLDRIEGDRVALVAFAGSSFLQTPLTLDYGAIQIFLAELDTEFIPVPGTAIGQAVDQALAAFEAEKYKKSRAIILITDGEDHEDSALAAAERAKLEEVKIYTIGIGQNGGAPIPDKRSGGFRKDPSGDIIMTHLDETTLQQMAATTGAVYVRSVSGDLDLERIYQSIRATVEDRDLKSGKTKHFEERFQWPLALALMLIFLEPFISRLGPKLLSFNFKFLAPWLWLTLGFSLFGQPSQAAFWDSQGRKGTQEYKDQLYDDALETLLEAQINDPENDKLKYNLGNTYYRLKQYDKAETLFQSSAGSQDPKLKQKSLYNLGNTAYHRGQLPAAVKHYQAALKLDPKDMDSQKNLQLVQQEILRRKQQQKQQQSSNSDQSENQEDSKKEKSESEKSSQAQQDKKQKGAQKQDGSDQAQQNKDEANPTQANEKGDKQQAQNGQPPKQDDAKSKQAKQDTADSLADAKKKDELSEAEKAAQEQKDKATQAQLENSKNAKDQDAKGQGAQTGQAQVLNPILSAQESQRWLSKLKENRKKYLKMQMPDGSKNKSRKDW